MLTHTRQQKREKGQTVVIFALAIVGLIAFVGLAVDGGNVLNERRITQNAADASALRGVHYLTSSDVPTETGLREVINGIVESNGIPDTDGTSGNAINENVTIYYTKENGEHITGCNLVPCNAPGATDDSPPSSARGVEVILDNQTDTYFMGVIGLNTITIGGRAVAVARGGKPSDVDLGDNVLVAFGQCEVDKKKDRPLDSSASYGEFIGELYSGSRFVNRGNYNHYHGQVTYGDGYDWVSTGADPVYDAGDPVPNDGSIGDPLAGLFTVEDFECSGGAIGSNYTCFDLTSAAVGNTCQPGNFDCIDTPLLKTFDPDGNGPLLYQQDGEWKLRSGIYYGGDYPFYNVGAPGMTGNITFVTNSFIKITEADVQLTGFMPAGSEIPGLLLFSNLDPQPDGEECTNHENLTDWTRPINTTGSSGTVLPQVHHDLEGCDNLMDNWDEGCVEFGSLRYEGIIYAPHGRVSTSGDAATYVGAIIAYTIRVNGYAQEIDRDLTDEVGVLFIKDGNVYPSGQQYIYLEE